MGGFPDLSPGGQGGTIGGIRGTYFLTAGGMPCHQFSRQAGGMHLRTGDHPGGVHPRGVWELALRYSFKPGRGLDNSIQP